MGCGLPQLVAQRLQDASLAHTSAATHHADSRARQVARSCDQGLACSSTLDSKPARGKIRWRMASAIAAAGGAFFRGACGQCEDWEGVQGKESSAMVDDEWWVVGGWGVGVCGGVNVWKRVHR